MTNPGPAETAAHMTRRMLIAGIGNIFLGDDGFGPEVAKRLAAVSLPGWVRVADYGMELSEPVAKAVDEAVRVVLDLVAKEGASHVPWHSR